LLPASPPNQQHCLPFDHSPPRWNYARDGLPAFWRNIPAKYHARDYQRARVYHWESRYRFTDRPISLDEAGELVQQLTGRADIDIRPGRSASRRAWARPWGSAICLPPFMRTAGVVCHESAHMIAFDHHGPRFMRVYCALLERAGLALEADAVASARAAGLDVAPAPAGADQEPL
jgi:hypothetical protein